MRRVFSLNTHLESEVDAKVFYYSYLQLLYSLIVTPTANLTDPPRKALQLFIYIEEAKKIMKKIKDIL